MEHSLYPGKVFIRAIQATLTKDELIGKNDPYCEFLIGKNKAKTEVCKDGAKSPYWSKVVCLKKQNEPYCDVSVKNLKFGLFGSEIGVCRIDLKDVEKDGNSVKWYNLFHENKYVGKVLLDITFQADMAKQLPSQSTLIHQNKVSQPTF